MKFDLTDPGKKTFQGQHLFGGPHLIFKKYIHIAHHAKFHELFTKWMAFPNWSPTNLADNFRRTDISQSSSLGTPYTFVNVSINITVWSLYWAPYLSQVQCDTIYQILWGDYIFAMFLDTEENVLAKACLV